MGVEMSPPKLGSSSLSDGGIETVFALQTDLYLKLTLVRVQSVNLKICKHIVGVTLLPCNLTLTVSSRPQPTPNVVIATESLKVSWRKYSNSLLQQYHASIILANI